MLVGILLTSFRGNIYVDVEMSMGRVVFQTRVKHYLGTQRGGHRFRIGFAGLLAFMGSAIEH